MTRELHLSGIYASPGGNLGGWRFPGSPPAADTDPRFLIAQARRLEAAGFDAVFFADQLAVPDVHPDVVERVSTVNDSLERLTMLAAIAAATERIGLIATASISYNAPAAIARQFASIDRISRGRAGWNVVTSLTDAEARNFGRSAHTDHEERYRQAEEAIRDVYRLWDEDGIAEASPQGRPVVTQAGASPSGRALAARRGELVFSGSTRLEDALEYAGDIRRRAEEAGRDPASVLVLPILATVVAPTRAEAEDKHATLTSLLHPRVALGDLEFWLGSVDLRGHDLDGPLPELPVTNQSHSHQRAVYDTARRESLTIRQFVQRAISAVDHIVVGTPEEIADHIQEWFDVGAADGFNLMFPYVPGSLDDFVDLVVPELRRRGIFRTEYRGRTLRDHLGLPLPRD